MKRIQEIRNELDLVYANLKACTDESEAKIYISQMAKLLKELEALL